VLCAGITIGPAELDLAQELLVIGRHGAGLDNLDLHAATERGIPVVYTPYGPTESTAEHVLMLMLAVARRLPRFDRAVREGEFGIRDQPTSMGRQLYGKALGIVGFGRIGTRLAEMARDALAMPIYVFDPFVDPKAVIEWGATPITALTDLARAVDLLSVHVPLTPQTRGLISRDVIGALRTEAILVNASRGAVLDETALVEALREDRIGGAGLDVFDPQPPRADNPLLQFDNVVLTPHVGSFTHEARRNMGITVAADVLSVLSDGEPQYLANPQVWERRRTQPPD
jgi:phosphoglycerate dehydrogenase-like enzyme